MLALSKLHVIPMQYIFSCATHTTPIPFFYLPFNSMYHMEHDKSHTHRHRQTHVYNTRLKRIQLCSLCNCYLYHQYYAFYCSTLFSLHFTSGARIRHLVSELLSLRDQFAFHFQLAAPGLLHACHTHQIYIKQETMSEREKERCNDG